MTLTLRQATPKDLGFVFSIALNGARHGHFDAKILSDRTECRHYFAAAIETGADPWGSPTEVSVVATDAERVGAVVATRAIGTPDEGVELAMIAFGRASRGKGYGATVVDAFLQNYLPAGSVYARCRPASDILRQMLLRRGFAEVGRSGDSVILRHGATGSGASPAVPAPAMLSPGTRPSTGNDRPGRTR